MGTKVNSNYESLLTFTRASKGHALRPVSYGDELVENGDFAANSDWTLEYATISGGVVSVTSGFRFLAQDAGLEVGKVYYVSFDYTETSSSQLRVNTTATNAGQEALITSTSGTGSGTIQGAVVAEGPYIAIEAKTQVFTGTIDNVSVKEVLFDQTDGTLTLFEHPDNVPRVEWDADRNRLGLLVEELRTNTVVYSEDLSNTSEWDANGVLDPVLSTVRPPTNNGFAYKVIEDTSNGGHLFSPKVSITSGNTYTFSVFAKAAERSILRVGAISTYFGSNTAAFFDLSDGSLGTVQNNASASIEDFGNGWYRCSWTADAINTSTGFDRVFLGPSSADNTFSYQGDGSSGIYLWGAQFEEGSFPTSYIKNEGTASGKDRSADVASIPVADFGWNKGAGTVVAEVDTADASNFGILWSANADSFQNRTLAYINNDLIYMYNRKNNGTEVNDPYANAPLDNTPLKHGYAFTDGDFNHTLNGGAVETVASNEMPVGINSFDIGNRLYTSGGHINGHIKSIQYYPRRLTNAQLQDLTS